MAQSTTNPLVTTGVVFLIGGSTLALASMIAASIMQKFFNKIKTPDVMKGTDILKYITPLFGALAVLGLLCIIGGLSYGKSKEIDSQTKLNEAHTNALNPQTSEVNL
ncbi:MAG: hypothetical protein OEY79_04060 [Anaplasmataceae bacterium]|nr:hypothetical protein [Anaplasmataceae bacterium]